MNYQQDCYGTGKVYFNPLLNSIRTVFSTPGEGTQQYIYFSPFLLNSTPPFAPPR